MAGPLPLSVHVWCKSIPAKKKGYRMNEYTFAKERDAAFVDFVKTGDNRKALAFCLKYDVRIPDSYAAFAGGIYKAVQHCTGITEDVKKLAAEKCAALGMNPYTLGGKENEID